MAWFIFPGQCTDEYLFENPSYDYYTRKYEPKAINKMEN
jgi:hypothetical protein